MSNGATIYSWSPVTLSAAFAPRDGAGALCFDGRMWLLGGWNPGDKVHFPTTCNSEVWSSVDGKNWTFHGDGRVWVLEGWHELGTNRNDVWHSADGVDWEELADTPWAPRHAASVFVFDDALWMVAGNNMESDVWKLTRTGG
jgi:hypothetical protein